MNMLKIICLAMALLSQATRAAPPAIAVTILCDSGYPPYSYAENGQAKGLYTDILRAAFARMPAYQVSIQPVPWQRGLEQLEHGKAFALYPPYYRPQERPWMDYSQPILAETRVIVVAHWVANVRNPADFPGAYAGLRIGLNAGFSPPSDLPTKQMIRRGQLTLERARDNNANLLKLKLGRIDAYINDRLSILWTLQQLRQSGELPAEAFFVEGATLSHEQGYLGFTNRDQGTFDYKADFIRSLNAALVELEREGVIEQLSAGYSAAP